MKGCIVCKRRLARGGGRVHSGLNEPPNGAGMPSCRVGWVLHPFPGRSLPPSAVHSPPDALLSPQDPKAADKTGRTPAQLAPDGFEFTLDPEAKFVPPPVSELDEDLGKDQVHPRLHCPPSPFPERGFYCHCRGPCFWAHFRTFKNCLNARQRPIFGLEMVVLLP